MTIYTLSKLAGENGVGRRAKYRSGGNMKADLPADRFELFLLGDGEKKVTWALDTRVPNTAIFTFNKEDHTLGNLLSSRLHKYPTIKFSAYIIPHPLKPSFDLRVTTDGSITPRDAIVQACRDVVQDLEVLSREFTKEWELKKITNIGRD